MQAQGCSCKRCQWEGPLLDGFWWLQCFCIGLPLVGFGALGWGSLGKGSRSSLMAYFTAYPRN
jgi:hypothetical protein